MDIKVPETQQKALLTVETKFIDQESRTITFLGTSNRQDRSGDIITAQGWDVTNYLLNPVFLWAHDGRSNPPIGRAVELTHMSNGLKFKIEFATKEILPFADTVFKLYSAGFLKAVSVGFLPKKAEVIRDSQTQEFLGFKFLEQELIELSAVSVPDNPEALVQEAADGLLKKEAAEFLTKSLHVEETFLDTVQALKKEIILMAAEEKVLKGKDTASQTKENELTVDKRLENMENRLEQLEALSDMQKSATEVFQAVKYVLEGVKSKGTNGIANPFLAVLDPGNEPKGDPQDQKALIEAITTATKKISTWKPTKPE